MPLGLYLACCASKETGVFVPLLLPLLEWRALTELLVWAVAAVGLLWLVGLVSLGRQQFDNVGLPGVIWMVSDPGCTVTAVGVLFTLLALIGGFRQSPALTLFCCAWVILCVAINSFSPPAPHRYYLTNAGFALLCGSGLSLWVVKLRSWLAHSVFGTREFTAGPT